LLQGITGYDSLLQGNFFRLKLGQAQRSLKFGYSGLFPQKKGKILLTNPRAVPGAWLPTRTWIRFDCAGHGGLLD
jgi:hypothetical protein